MLKYFFIMFYFSVNICKHSNKVIQILSPFSLTQFKSVQFSRSVVSDSLQPHEPGGTPSPTPRVHPNPCPSSQWCHPSISSSVIPVSSCPQSFLTSGFFSNEPTLHIRWPKYWSFSFSISPSNEYSGLISFKIYWFDLLAFQGTLKSFFPASQFRSISSSVLSLLYGPTLTSIHDYWKNHSFD